MQGMGKLSIIQNVMLKSPFIHDNSEVYTNPFFLLFLIFFIVKFI